MNALIYTLAVIQLLLGMLFFISASTSIQEIGSATIFGAGAICLGIAVATTAIKGIRADLATSRTPTAPATDVVKSQPATGVIRTYKGQEIMADDNGVSVNGVWLPNVQRAERHIDNLHT